MWDKLKGFFSRGKEEPYLIDYKVYTAVLSLSVKLSSYYGGYHQGFAYIIEDGTDLPILIEGLLSSGRGSIVDKDIRKQYKEIRTGYEGGILLYKGANGTGKEMYRLDDIRSKRIIESLGDNVYYPKQEADTELYKGHVALLKLLTYTMDLGFKQKAMYKDKEDYIAMFEGYKNKQDFIDYIVKMDIIGNDQIVFNALTVKDEETLRVFFEPINTMIEYIEQKQLEKQTVGKVMDMQRLDSVLRWSSTELREVEIPTMDLEGNLLGSIGLQGFNGTDKDKSK